MVGDRAKCKGARLTFSTRFTTAVKVEGRAFAVHI